MSANEQFYLGRLFDAETGKTGVQPLLYDPADLTTHAVVVGMTGSGKTGLCISLLEEAALQGIPALMIDPKGDITNALLHFPELTPQDFIPWINPDQARRERQTPEQAAAQTAENWRKGMNEWGIGIERMQALANSAHYAVYTPGSDAGIPISILASLKVPPISWESNRELLREKISGTVTALLSLVGLSDIDPVRSREHILLSNIFEFAWSQGKDLELGELILQTQNPPFTRLGVFDVNTFFPEKERFSLAMLLNNILASPAFQAWIEGQPLDIQALLYAPDGRPRHSVFYIAHLSDAERMFFVTLLYSAVETWMRVQNGSTSLRAILYFDEIYGYLPPIGNPPSKRLILRMAKQARAFGVGQVLVTQNPVDLDYKVLSNAGTWLIGKLQTEQDKQRLLDGLESAASGMDRNEYDRLISKLGKRIFLLHNIHDPHPTLFQTRQAMNYLAGPLTRAQIPALNKLVNAAAASEVKLASASKAATYGGALQNTPPPMTYAESEAQSDSLAHLQPISAITGESLHPAEPALASVSVEKASPDAHKTTTRPAIPTGINEYFLPNNVTFSEAFKAAGHPYPPESYSQGLLYRPVILGQAQIRFFNPRYGGTTIQLDYTLYKTILVLSGERRGVIRWEDYTSPAIDPQLLDQAPIPQALFAGLAAPLSDGRGMKALQADFLDWAYRTGQVVVRVHPALRVSAGPDVSQAEFRTRCAEAARQKRDAEIKKSAAAFDKKLAALEARLEREQRALDENEVELSQRKMEELGTHAENLFGLFGNPRRRLSTSLAKRRLTEQTKADVKSNKEVIKDHEEQIEQLEEERTAALAEISQRWGQVAADFQESAINPLKKDVLLDLFGLAWMPFHLVNIGNETIELPGFMVRGEYGNHPGY